MADHGDGMASHRMVTKHISFYDEMTNVPFISCRSRHQTTEKPVDQSIDTAYAGSLPTLCDLAGISVPVEKQGTGVRTHIKRRGNRKDSPLCSFRMAQRIEYVVTPGRMVRGPRYKYTHSSGRQRRRTIWYEKDPGERKNLAKDPKYSKVLAEHRAMLDDYITRIKDDYRSLKVDAGSTMQKPYSRLPQPRRSRSPRNTQKKIT